MKKGTVAPRHKASKKFSLPPDLPAFEELEVLAASAVPNLVGAWWITHQVTEHVFSAIGKVDPRTGVPLSKPLTEILDAIRQATATGCRPFPHDQLLAAAHFAEKSLGKLLDQYRHRIVRVHEQLPFHQIREVDTRSMAWLTRQPGRNVREKLSGRTHALGIKHSVTTDTTENRLLQSFAKLLIRRVNERLAFSDAYDKETGDIERVQKLTDCMVLCDERMRRSELANVPTMSHLQPNNVLLSDPLYSRVFRAWKWLRDDENSLQKTWSDTLERTRILLFWMVAANLASQKRVVVMESIGRIHTGRGEEHDFCIELLRTEDNCAVWQIKPELHFLVHPTGYKDPAFQIRVSVEGDYIMAHVVILAGQGVLYEESTSVFAFEVLAAPERLMCKRGIGIVVNGLEIDPRQANNGYADIAGLAGFAENMAGQILWRCGLNFTKEKNKPIHLDVEKNTVNKARLGIDLGNTSISVSAAQPVPLSAAAWTMALELPNEVNSFEWLNGRVDRHVIYGAAARSLWTSGNLFEADEQTDAGMLALSANRVLGNLKDVLHITTDTRIAYSVPDFIDEFSQRSLRSAFAASFKNPVPVWRSVAAAMAWVSSKAVHICPGESILVVDIEYTEVSQTVLTARFDNKLKREHPSSHGIFWERKPPLSPDEGLEILGWPHVLREYALHIVNRALVSQPENEIYRIADDLLRTNMIAQLINRGGSVFIQVPSSESSLLVVVELCEDCDWFDINVEKWIKSVVDGIDAACNTVSVRSVLLVGGVFGYDRFQQSKAKIGRIKFIDEKKGFGFINPNDSNENIYFSLVSLQDNLKLKGNDLVEFEIRDGRKGVEAKNVEVVPSLSEWLNKRITISPSLLALGAYECLLRLDTGCVTWREWLPELSLELIHDGHYSELQLLKCGVFIDPFLGKEEQFTIPEKLTLQSGKKWFSFPLLLGRQDRRPIAWEARLESSAFPLDRNVEVELQLSYRYGLENSYQLSVVPVAKEDAPFERIVAKWTSESMPINAPSSNDPITFQSLPWTETDSEKFVSATKSVTRIDDEKFGKFLFAITRGCWSQGRCIASAPLKVQQVFPSFRDYLFHIVSQSSIQTAKNIPRALEILVLLHEDAPSAVIGDLLRLDQEATDNPSLYKKTSTMMAMLVGDGTRERARILERLLNHLKRHTNPATLNLALAGMSIRAIGNAAWRSPGFIISLAKESDAVRLIIGQCQRLLNNLFRIVPLEIPTAEKREKVEFKYGTLFRDACELLLALLRIDESNPEVALLKRGSSTADALAKVIRQLDARFVAIGVHVLWRVHLNANIDKALHRMSPVAFTLNTYLAKGSGSNFVQITGVDMD